MIQGFNVSERGQGSYWMLGILRWVMVLIFVSFGIQKFTPQSAHGIAVYISNSPFVSWLSMFGVRGEANLLGVIELTTGAFLAIGAFIPIFSALGSLMGVGTFAITWSFFFTTPGVVKWSLSIDPIAWNLAGEFLLQGHRLALCLCRLRFWRRCQRASSRSGRIVKAAKCKHGRASFNAIAALRPSRRRPCGANFQRGAPCRSAASLGRRIDQSSSSSAGPRSERRFRTSCDRASSKSGVGGEHSWPRRG